MVRLQWPGYAYTISRKRPYHIIMPITHLGLSVYATVQKGDMISHYRIEIDMVKPLICNVFNNYEELRKAPFILNIIITAAVYVVKLSVLYTIHIILPFYHIKGHCLCRTL